MISITPMPSWNAFSATAANPTGFSVDDRHKDVALLPQTARPDRLGLVSAPVGVQAEKDLVPEDLLNRVEDGCPRPEGESDHGVEVSFAELADLNRVLGHGAARRRLRRRYQASAAATASSLICFVEHVLDPA
jgi:hypothetical protein